MVPLANGMLLSAFVRVIEDVLGRHLAGEDGDRGAARRECPVPGCQQARDGREDRLAEVSPGGEAGKAGADNDGVEGTRAAVRYRATAVSRAEVFGPQGPSPAGNESGAVGAVLNVPAQVDDPSAEGIGARPVAAGASRGPLC